MKKTMNINAVINNVTENEIAILKAIFGNRITIEIPEVKKEAPKAVATKATARPKKTVNTTAKATQNKAEKPVKAEEKPIKTEEKQPKTRKEAIADWKVSKYGSTEIADAVKKMTAVVAKEWSDQYRATGKLVCPRNEYKTRLWAEAERRVKEAK